MAVSVMMRRVIWNLIAFVAVVDGWSMYRSRPVRGTLGNSTPMLLAGTNDNEENPDSLNDFRKKIQEKKFNGQSVLFQEPNNGSPSPRTPYDREMNLASNFQRGLPLLAATVLISITFAVYIGLSGGITDGSERFFDDDIDDVPWMNNNEQSVIYEQPSASSVVM